MRDNIYYEWVFEEYEDWGDIIDPLWSDTLKGALSNEPENPDHEIGIVLVRNEGNKSEGLKLREYAYLKEGVLPPDFDDGYPVPKRFHKEVERNDLPSQTVL